MSETVDLLRPRRELAMAVNLSAADVALIVKHIVTLFTLLEHPPCFEESIKDLRDPTMAAAVARARVAAGRGQD